MWETKQKKADKFHKLAENMLFDTKIAQMDTGTSISYQTSRVRDLDQIDWLKIVHMFKYFRGTKVLPLILIAYNSVMPKWFIYG